MQEVRHSRKRRASGPLLHDFIKESSFAVSIMLSLRHSRSFYSQNNLMDNDTGQCQDLQHQQGFLEIVKHFFPHSITTSSSILSILSGHVVKYLVLFPFDWITVSKERWHWSANLDFERSNWEILSNLIDWGFQQHLHPPNGQHFKDYVLLRSSCLFSDYGSIRDFTQHFLQWTYRRNISCQSHFS